MTVTTQALVLKQAGGELDLESVNVHGPGDDEVLVEMVATGICQSDLTCISGKLPVPTPSIFGHEGAGIVHTVGQKWLLSFSPGDQVILTFNSCGSCYYCKSERPAYCFSFPLCNRPSNLGSDGKGPLYTTVSDSRPIWGKFFGQSSFSRYAVVSPRTIVNITTLTGLKLTQHELQMLAPLGCGVQTGMGCVLNSLNVTKNSSFVVFGAGAVGLSALLAAKSRGATTIIAVDLVESRLSLAKELGATHTLLGNDSNLIENLKSITSATQGVQFAIDTTGVPDVVGNMLGSLGILGKGASVGLAAPQAEAKININTVIARGQSYIGSTEGDSIPSKLIPALIEEYRDGRFPLDKLVQTYPVAEYRLAFNDMKSGKTIKPILLW